MVEKEFNLEEFDVDADSSDDSKFNVKDQPLDLIDNFKSIGEQYAGTGTSSPNKNSKSASKEGYQDEVRNESNTFKVAPDAQKSVAAYHAAFHGKGIRQDSEEDDENDEYGRPQVPTNSNMKTNATMQASMFARDFTTGSPNKKKVGLKQPLAVQPIVEEDNFLNQNIDNFTSISNVKASRDQNPSVSAQGGVGVGVVQDNRSRFNLMDQLKDSKSHQQSTQMQNPNGFMSNNNKLQLETVGQWKFDPDRQDKSQGSNRLGQSARLSQNLASRQMPSEYGARDGDSSMETSNIQDYSTLQQKQQVENMRQPGKQGSQVSGSLHQSDAAFAQALLASRQPAVDVAEQMTLEIQDQRDINPLDSQIGPRTNNKADRKKLQTRSKVGVSDKLSPNKKIRKVKGNLGLAVHHGPVDAIQTFDGLNEDEILRSVEAASKMSAPKIKDEDDFGMSSDEENEISKRKKAEKQKRKEEQAIEEAKREKAAKKKAKEVSLTEKKRKAKEAAAAAEAEEADVLRIMEEQRIFDEAKRKLREDARRKQREEMEENMRMEAEFDKQRSSVGFVRMSQEGQQPKENDSPSEPPEMELSPTKQVVSEQNSITQVMSFADQQDQFQAVDEEPNPGQIQRDELTPIHEMYDETTGHLGGLNRASRAGMNGRGSSPAADSDKYRSNSKMIITDSQESSIIQGAPTPTLKDVEQNTVQAKTNPKQPSFLGKIGAMLGLMQASKFTGTEKEEDDDGRVGSASTNKSRQSYNLQSQKGERPDASKQSNRSRQSNKNKPQSSKHSSRPPSNMQQSERASAQSVRDQLKQVDVGELTVQEAAAQNELPPSTSQAVLDQSAKSSQQRSRRSNRSRRSHKGGNTQQSNSPSIHIGDAQNESEVYQGSLDELSPQHPVEIVSMEQSPFEPQGQIMHFQTAEDQQEYGADPRLMSNPSEDNLPRAHSKQAFSPIEEQKVRLQTPNDQMKPPKSQDPRDELNLNARQLRQQKRLEKATKTGQNLNDSYYEEVDSNNDDNMASQQADPYEINNQRHGYESSSTAHKEFSKAATRLKKKAAQFGKEETTKGGFEPPVDSNYVDPEKDETHALFKQRKLELQEQGLRLNKGDFNQLHPHSGKQAIVDTLRFVGVFIYLADLCFKIAYFKNTKWISAQLRDIYYQVFYVRVYFVLFYHAWFILFSYQRSYIEYQRDRKLPGYDVIKVTPAMPSERVTTDESDTYKEVIQAEKLREEKRRIAKSTLSQLCEITVQAVMLPVTMYTGFSRLVTMPQIKTNYLYVALGQEILLHQVPLSMFFWYNSQMLGKPQYTLDQVFVISSIVHFSWVFFELMVQRGFSNTGVNLEQRIKHTSDVRMKDTMRLGIISGIIGAVFLVPAFTAFDKQICKENFFEVGAHECRDCFDYHGDECTACQDAEVCLGCVQGHYLNATDSLCYLCKETWRGCVDCVYNSPPLREEIVYDQFGNPINSIDVNLRGLQSTSLSRTTTTKTTTIPEPTSFYVGDIEVGVGSKCLEAAHGFFFDKNGIVTSCKQILNCVEGYCTQDGCTQCEVGYYLEEGVCKQCQINGCARCSAAKQCIECTSDFLQVQEDGSCKCNIGDGIFPHLSQDRRGSCVCEDGYWLTELGCQTCEDLIPGCEQCYRTSSNTQIALYEGANVSSFSRQYYIDCRKCQYHDYRQRANVSQGLKPQCIPCAEKWEGCGDCGTYGNRCSKCLETHVYDARNYYEPCRPCWCWMGRCIWCRGSSICVKRWEPSLPWPTYDLTCA